MGSLRYGFVLERLWKIMSLAGLDVANNIQQLANGDGVPVAKASVGPQRNYPLAPVRVCL